VGATDAEDPDAALNGTLDVLIDQQRRLLEVYASRATVTDARAAGALTLVFAIATVTVTAAQSLTISSLERTVALIGYGGLVAAVVVVLIGRTVAGLRRGRGNRVSSDSDRTRAAGKRLDNFVSLDSRTRGASSADEGEADLDVVREKARTTRSVDVRIAALELWRARTDDAREAAQHAARWAAFATVFVVVGLGFLAAFGVALICT